MLFLHPHPTDPRSTVCCMLGTDDTGLERATRLLPLRTGIAVPDFIVVSQAANWIGAGGVVAAGYVQVE